MPIVRFPREPFAHGRDPSEGGARPGAVAKKGAGHDQRSRPALWTTYRYAIDKNAGPQV